MCSNGDLRWELGHDVTWRVSNCSSHKARTSSSDFTAWIITDPCRPRTELTESGHMFVQQNFTFSSCRHPEALLCTKKKPPVKTSLLKQHFNTRKTERICTWSLESPRWRGTNGSASWNPAGSWGWQQQMSGTRSSAGFTWPQTGLQLISEVAASRKRTGSNWTNWWERRVGWWAGVSILEEEGADCSGLWPSSTSSRKAGVTNGCRTKRSRRSFIPTQLQERRLHRLSVCLLHTRTYLWWTDFYSQNRIHSLWDQITFRVKRVLFLPVLMHFSFPPWWFFSFCAHWNSYSCVHFLCM